MADSSRLLDLANKIQVQVAEIQKHLTATGQADPSFDGQAKATHFGDVDDTRSAALENLTELHDLLLTPLEMLRSRMVTEHISRQVIDRFRIDEAVPLDGTVTYEELAEKTHISVEMLRRIMRSAMTFRIFHEPTPNHVAHTQASRLMVENSHVRDLMGTLINEVWPASTHVCDAIVKWPNEVSRAQCGYVLATGKQFYEALAADPVRQARHDNAYGAFSGDRAHSLHHITDNYDWTSLGSGKIVDVGGGAGTISKHLAANFPNLRFIVQDQSSVLEQRDFSADHPHIEFMVHDFFTPQPVRDADLYLFRRVLMDWTDEQVVQILRNLVPALRHGTRILVVDSQMPEPGTCPVWLLRGFCAFDLLGPTIGARGSRGIGEWESLFREAAPEFNLRKVLAVPETEIAIIEAVWTGGNA